MELQKLPNFGIDEVENFWDVKGHNFFQHSEIFDYLRRNFNATSDF
jgi:hypothetical protein